MKKLLIFSFALLCAACIFAQNVSSEYDKYLKDAFSALREGKVETAQKWYNVYKKLTGNVDEDFESLINDATANAWENSCYIINLGNGEYLAVQKITSDQQPLKFDDAKSRCSSVRIGGFRDWRLPTESELNTIFSFITLPIKEYFWTSYHYYYFGDWSINDKNEKWLIIYNDGTRVELKEEGYWDRKFYKNGIEISSNSDLLKNHYLAVRKFTR